MYRKEKRIPTFLALLILFIGISSAVYLDRNVNNMTTLAKQISQPEDIHFTNISDNSFVVSWVTAKPTVGFIEINNNTITQTYLDDLDNDNITKPRTLHYVTIKNLVENTQYKVKILSGNKNCNDIKYCPTFIQQTSKKLGTTLSLPPVHGTILLKDNTPANNAIVYLIISKSSPISGITDSSGLFVIPLNNLRTQDLTTRPEIADNDLVQISTLWSPDQNANAVIDIKTIRQNITIPNIIMGNSYNFIDLLSKSDYLAKINNQKILGINIQKNTIDDVIPTSSIGNSIDIIFPKKDEDITPDTRPRFRGTGLPGSELLIIVNSTPQKSQLKVGKDGIWIYRPTTPLSPGIHHINIQGYDNLGKFITITRKFIVLKSGEQVLGESTPSASFTPTQIPSATPIMPTLTPDNINPSPTTPQPTEILTSTPSVFYPSSTPSTTPPSTGNSTPIFILLGTSLAFLAVGFKLLIFS